METRRRREGTQRGPRRRRLAGLAAWGVVGLLTQVGCQVEYAGMTLPSGKYMFDDVQYFAPGPDFPWANTQAATQRARMQAMGLDVPDVPSTAPLGTPPPAAGALAPVQNISNMPTNVNTMPRKPVNVPAPPAPGIGPDGNVPAPGDALDVPAGGNAGTLPP